MDLVDVYKKSPVKFVYSVSYCNDSLIIEYLNMLGLYFSCWNHVEVELCKKAGVPKNRIYCETPTTEESILTAI